MPSNLSSIPNTSIKVRWKEPYASTALNQKFAAVIPSGVYRGLRLAESGADLSVDVVDDPVRGDHVAVFESVDGFSTTYRDSTSGLITLDLSSYTAGTTVVVSLFIDYAIFTNTTGEFRGYTQAEFDALSDAVRESLVVLGTILMTASGIIPAANINHDGRKTPFLQRPSESVPWNPMIRNGGFELGDTGETFLHASPFWETSVSSGNFTIGPVDTDSNTGEKCLEVECLSAGAITATAKQTLYMTVIAGRQLRARLYKKAVQAATSAPIGRVRFAFEDKDGLNDTNVDVNFDIDAIDVNFVKFDGVIIVPDDMTVLKTVEITISGNYGATGPCIRMDDFQAWCEVDAEDWLVTGSALASEVETDKLFVGNRLVGLTAAKIAYDGSRLEISRRDGNTALVQPGLEWFAPTSEVAADAPRIITPAAASGAGVEFTLIHESKPAGEKGCRTYVTPTGTVVRTVNAWYNNTSGNWTKDVSAGRASREDFSEGFTTNRFKQGGTSSWTDAQWQMGQSFDRFGVLSRSHWTTWTQNWLQTGTEMQTMGGWQRAGNVILPLPQLSTAGPVDDMNSVGMMYTSAGASLKTKDYINLNATKQIMIMDIGVAVTVDIDGLEWGLGFGDGTDMRTSTNYLRIHRPPKVDASDTYLIEASDSIGVVTESIDTGVLVSTVMPHSLRVRIEVIGSAFDEGYKTNFYIDDVFIGALTNIAALPTTPVGAGFFSEATGSEELWWSAMNLTWNVKKV